MSDKYDRNKDRRYGYGMTNMTKNNQYLVMAGQAKASYSLMAGQAKATYATVLTKMGFRYSQMSGQSKSVYAASRVGANNR
jgi:hypothetical protein